MKRVMTILVALAFAGFTLSMAACSSSAAKRPTSSPGSASGVLKTDYENALSIVNQLALGTFKLEEQGAPLTAEQADQLRTLWKGYLALTNSSSTAPIELEGLTSQLERAYSEEQLKAIAGMRLSMQDTMEIAQEMNLNFQEPGAGSAIELTAEQQATREALRRAAQSGGGGGFPGGPGGGSGPGGRDFVFGGPALEMSGGGMGGGMGGGFGPGAVVTPGAPANAQAQGSRIERVSPALIRALIDYLQTVAAGQ